jgi:oleandomycin transport system ATP-binding protein
MIARLSRIAKREARDRAAGLFAALNLEWAADRPVRSYSGGMRRRLDLAASLIGQPSVLFLDEPTTGLDPRSRLTLWGIIGDLVAGGTTLLLTTQYLDEADRLASQIAVIDHGRVIATGTAAELKAKIGRQTLDVRPADPADLTRVAGIVAAAVGRAPISTEEDPGLLSVPVDDAQALPPVVSGLQGERIEVTELALRLASLDEVFMALTGHAAEEGDR